MTLLTGKCNGINCLYSLRQTWGYVVYITTLTCNTVHTMGLGSAEYLLYMLVILIHLIAHYKILPYIITKETTVLYIHISISFQKKPLWCISII